MATLDLYKNRTHNIVKVTNPKTKEITEYKLPNEYTVEEVERLLELQIQREKLEKQKVEGQGAEQLVAFWAVVFDQLEILFQHFNPELDAAKIRSIVTHKEALDILGFYNTHRFQTNEEDEKTSKKKQQ